MNIKETKYTHKPKPSENDRWITISWLFFLFFSFIFLATLNFLLNVVANINGLFFRWNLPAHRVQYYLEWSIAESLLIYFDRRKRKWKYTFWTNSTRKTAAVTHKTKKKKKPLKGKRHKRKQNTQKWRQHVWHYII